MYTTHCKNGLVLTQPEYSTYTSKPAYCTCCSKPRLTTDTNGYDMYALRLNLSRKMAYHMLITIPRTLNITREVGHQSNQYCSPKYTKGAVFSGIRLSNITNGDLAEISMSNMPAHLVHGTAQLRAFCTQCGSTFNFQVSSPDNLANPTMQTQHSKLTYCPYCSTPTLNIVPNNWDHWSSLGDLYNMPVLAIKAYFKFWSQQTQIRTFSDFMAQVPARLAKELNAPRKSNQKAVKLIRIVVKKPKSAIPKYANTPKPTTVDFFNPKSHNLCQTCHETELSKLIYICTQCRSNHLIKQVQFHSNGGC